MVRSYSIANAPRRDGLISLLVTRVPGGQLSGWVHDVLRPGGRVLLSGPYGSFTAAPGEHGPILLPRGRIRAGPGPRPGRGGTPSTGHDAPVVLFFSARTPRDLIDDERFHRWQRRHPERFRYLRTLTRANGPPPAGRIPAILGGWFPGPVRLAGLHRRGARVRDRVREPPPASLRAVPRRVHTEEFFTEPRPWGAAQPAAATRR